MRKRPIIDFLAGTFLLAYAAWGVVLLAQELGWFQYGHPVSLIFVIIGGISPAIIAYFILKKSDPMFSLKKYLRDAFAIKQKPLHLHLIPLCDKLAPGNLIHNQRVSR